MIQVHHSGPPLRQSRRERVQALEASFWIQTAHPFPIVPLWPVAGLHWKDLLQLSTFRSSERWTVAIGLEFATILWLNNEMGFLCWWTSFLKLKAPFHQQIWLMVWNGLNMLDSQRPRSPTQFPTWRVAMGEECCICYEGGPGEARASRRVSRLTCWSTADSTVIVSSGFLHVSCWYRCDVSICLTLIILINQAFQCACSASPPMQCV